MHGAVGGLESSDQEFAGVGYGVKMVVARVPFCITKRAACQFSIYRIWQTGRFRAELKRWKSASCDDFDDFEAVAGLELAVWEFGGCDGFAVMFDDDAAGKQILGGQELVECARESALDAAVVGDDEGRCHLFCR
jgi:hypothetical protein